MAAQIQFPDEVKSYVIQSFHHQMLELSIDALQDELEAREYQAAVFTFPESHLPALKEKVKDLQQDLVAFVQDIVTRNRDSQNLGVYYYGAQCFSLQRPNLELFVESEEGLNA